MGYVLEREAVGVLRGGRAVKSGGIHEPPGASAMKHRRLGALNHPSGLPRGSGGWKSEIKVLGGLSPSESHEERICSRPLSLACQWPSSLSIPSCCLPSVQAHLYVQFPLFIRKPVILDYRPTLLQYDSS